MKKPLSALAEIFYGPHLSTSFKGDVKYLASSHFDQNIQPALFRDSYIKEKVARRYYLSEGDVIFTGKGQRLFAWAYDSSFGEAVPSSLFYIIRIIESELIKAEYLALVLNSDRVIHKLKALSGGTSIPSIQKKELENLAIEIPNLERQEKTIEISKLLNEDISLAMLLLKQKRKLKKGIINKILTQKNIES